MDKVTGMIVDEQNNIQRMYRQNCCFTTVLSTKNTLAIAYIYILPVYAVSHKRALANCTPRSDSAEGGVWSETTLFAVGKKFLFNP